MESKYTKLFYSIGEVAEILNVSTSLIRYWDKEFGYLLKLRKNPKGNRLFTGKEIEKLILIYDLLKVKGFTIQGAKNYLKENRSIEIQCSEIIEKGNTKTALNASNKAELIELLQKIKDTLVVLIDKKF